MKHLLIIGARGWGREIYNMLPDCLGYQSEFDVKGFLDDNEDALNGMPGYPSIIGSVEDYIPQSDDVFVCAMGDSKWRKHYVGIVLSKNGTFINLIHKTATIDRNTSIGIGNIITANVFISCDIIIGSFVTFQSHSIIGHDARIGDFSTLGTRSFMGGYAKLGEAVTLHTNAIVLPHVTIGDNSVVGAGSVVIRKVPNGTTVYGNPATKLKY